MKKQKAAKSGAIVTRAKFGLKSQPPNERVRVYAKFSASPTAREDESNLTGVAVVLAKRKRAALGVAVAGQVLVPTPLAKFVEGSSNFANSYNGPWNERATQAAITVGILNALPSALDMVLRGLSR